MTLAEAQAEQKKYREIEAPRFIGDAQVEPMLVCVDEAGEHYTRINPEYIKALPNPPKRQPLEEPVNPYLEHTPDGRSYTTAD